MSLALEARLLDKAFSNQPVTALCQYHKISPDTFARHKIRLCLTIVPQPLIDRMARVAAEAGEQVAVDHDEAKAARKKAVAAANRAEGVKLCVEIIDRCRNIEGVHGVHIMAVEWEEIVRDIVTQAGLKDLPE